MLKRSARAYVVATAAFASMVTANELKRDPRLLYRAGELGFKKIVLSDGYDFAWSWTL